MQIDETNALWYVTILLNNTDNPIWLCSINVITVITVIIDVVNELVMYDNVMISK